VLFTSRIRTIGRFAALAAVYALVLNVVLTSAVLATISPLKANAFHELCLNGSSAAPDANGQTDDSKPIIRCPLCTAGAIAMDVPSPSPALAIRIALQIKFEPARHGDGAPLFAASDHQPRGPPSLS
jgi:hypothetical protein